MKFGGFALRSKKNEETCMNNQFLKKKRAQKASKAVSVRLSDWKIRGVAVENTQLLTYVRVIA